MLKFFKMWIGLLLLPACWAISRAVYFLYLESQSTIEIETTASIKAWALPMGFISWIIIYFFLPRPTRTYVLGHELTHALWALMMGARVEGMKIREEGGYVQLTRTNFLITLSPYFFPFYSMIVIALYYLLSIWIDLYPYKSWWLGLVGFTWAFHITFTIHMLTSFRQPDIQEHGRIFSYTIIYLLNLLSIGIWMITIGQPTFQTLGLFLKQECTLVYMNVYSQLSYTAHLVWQMLQPADIR